MTITRFDEQHWACNSMLIVAVKDDGLGRFAAIVTVDKMYTPVGLMTN